MILWDEHGDPLCDGDDYVSDYVDEPAAMRALSSTLSPIEWGHWQSHQWVLMDPTDHDKPNFVERSCQMCHGWYELEWANDHDLTCTIAGANVRSCAFGKTFARNVVRTYSLSTKKEP